MGLDFCSKGLNDIAQIIGDKATEILISIAGGSKLYIPKQPIENHSLCQLGDEAFKLLTENFGGVYLPVARGSRFKERKRNAAIVDEKSNSTVASIAKKYDLTERQVAKILRKHKEDAPTLNSRSVA